MKPKIFMQNAAQYKKMHSSEGQTRKTNTVSYYNIANLVLTFELQQIVFTCQVDPGSWM